MKYLSKQNCVGRISNAGLILSMLKEKSSGVFGHSVATGIIAREIAVDIGLCDDDVNMLYLSGLLHDIGKIFIEDSILLSRKPHPQAVQHNKTASGKRRQNSREIYF